MFHCLAIKTSIGLKMRYPLTVAISSGSLSTSPSKSPVHKTNNYFIAIILIRLTELTSNVYQMMNNFTLTRVYWSLFFKLRNLKLTWNFFRVVGIITYVSKLNRKKNIIEYTLFKRKISLPTFHLSSFLVVNNKKTLFN